MAGKRIFRGEVAQALIEEIEENMDKINSQGVFDDNEQWNAVMKVHRQAIDTLRRRISETRIQSP